MNIDYIIFFSALSSFLTSLIFLFYIFKKEDNYKILYNKKHNKFFLKTPSTYFCLDRKVKKINPKWIEDTKTIIEWNYIL